MTSYLKTGKFAIIGKVTRKLVSMPKMVQVTRKLVSMPKMVQVTRKVVLGNCV